MDNFQNIREGHRKGAVLLSSCNEKSGTQERKGLVECLSSLEAAPSYGRRDHEAQNPPESDQSLYTEGAGGSAPFWVRPIIFWKPTWILHVLRLWPEVCKVPAVGTRVYKAK